MKNFKLKTIISITLISYVVLIASQFVNDWEDFKMGLIQGWNQSTEGKTGGQVSDVYFITVSPKESVLSFPEKIQNLKMKIDTKLRYHKMKVLYANEIQLSPKHKFYKALCTFLSFIIFAVYVYIPFQFYGLLNTFKREIFFELKIKKRFNNIGIALMVAYWTILLYNYLSYQIKISLFAFEDYEIIKDHTNVIWLILSFFFIIMAETISRGIKMKDEQELTV